MQRKKEGKRSRLESPWQREKPTSGVDCEAMQAQVTTLGFSGTLVGYANPSTVVQLTGGCFCFHEVDRNAQSHWPQNSKNPIDCACVHRRGGVLAYCEAEPGAPVIVVPIRVLTPVGKVNPETTAECAALSFSDDGHRLLTVHGPPDAWAALWSWRKGKCIASNRIRKECIGVGASVCPGSRSTSACVGESEACLMRHRPKRHGSALEILPVDGLPQRQSEAGVEKAGKLSEKLTSHCWLPGPDLLLASDGGSLFRVPARPDAAVRVNAQRVASVHAGIMDVDLLGPNVACAGSDGSVTILSASSFETRQSLSVGWGFAQSLAVSPSHNSLCVGTSSGRLVSFSAIDDEEDVNDPSLWQAPAEEGQDQDRSSKSRNASWRPGVDLDQQITRSKLLQAGHNAKVIGAGHVTNATVATVSSDGIVCFWSQDEEESLGLESMHTLLINSHVTVSAVGNGIIVIGTSDGCVRLYELGSNGDLAAGFQKIVHDGVVEEMAFDTGSGMIGTSGSDGSIAVISAQDGADSAFVRAILSAKNHPTCLAWCASGNKLAAGTESSEVEVHTFKGIKAASRASASGRSTIVHSLGLPTPPLAMTVRRNDGKLHAVGADCRVYEFTEASEEAEKVSEKLPGGGTPVGITCTGRVLTVGRETGEITTIDSGGLSLQGTWRLFGSTMPCVSSRVSTVVGLSNGSTVVCGEDGLIHMVITLQARKGHLRPPSLDVTTEPRPATSVSDPERFEAREDAAERQRIAQEREKNAEYFRKRCRELADRLSAAIEENTQADEYQQLPPEELVVDTSRYHALLEQGRKTAEEERRRSLEESLKQDLLRERIKQATKDRMERLGFEVKPFRQSPRRLFAESLRKRSEWEKQRARRVCFLRRVEKEEWSARGLPCLTQLAREQQGGGGNEMESSRGAKASESVGLSSTTIQDDLYSPVELHMPWRRLAQVVILKELQLTNKENFDKECEKLRDRKQDDLERMQEKRQRLQQIAEQMGWKEREREVADAIEEGWQAWRECQDETKEDVRSKDERENAQISMGEREQRALDEMMGGTLERSKLDEQAERLWQHEPWMDKPREEMSEEELAKLKEYEERLAEYEEEREKRRKSLEFEYRQLQSEIDTIAKNFDVQWWETYLSQQQHHRSIALMDLQALDLTIMTIDLYRLSSSVSELNSSVSSLRIARDTLVHTLEQLRKEEEQAKASAEQAHHELKCALAFWNAERKDLSMPLCSTQPFSLATAGALKRCSGGSTAITLSFTMPSSKPSRTRRRHRGVGARAVGPMQGWAEGDQATSDVDQA